MSEILESIGITEEIESRIKDIWNSKGLSLSIPFIDLQHIWLILLIVELEMYQKDDTKEPEFHRTALELINYTADHFSLEENLFVRFSYPKLLPHKRQHHSFIELIKSKLSHEKLDKNERREIIEFLWSWLAEHIQKEDSDYRHFLVNSTNEYNEWFKFLIENNQITIDKAQAALYNKVTNSTQVKEIISDNLYNSISSIWHMYNLSIGLPIIDLQHIWLIKMVVELDYASKTLVSNKREEIFRSIIKGAVQYTKDHFSLEEKIMQKFQYSGFPGHLKQHQTFVEIIQQRNKENKQGDIKAAANLVTDLKDWLLSHIAIEDRQMATVLRECIPDIIILTRELLKSGELKVRKSQMDLYNRVIGLKGL